MIKNICIIGKLGYCNRLYGENLMSDKENQQPSNQDKLLLDKIEKLEQGLIDLQTQVAFMEDTVEQLDRIVTEQSQLIADQTRQLQLMYQKLESQHSTSQIQPFDLLNDKPPHY